MKIRRNITICPIVWAELQKLAKKSGRSISSLIEEDARKRIEVSKNAKA